MSFDNYFKGFNQSNINIFLQQIKSTINTVDGEKLAKLLSIENTELNNDVRNLIANVQINENLILKTLESPWNDIVKYHLLSLQALIINKDYILTFEHKCSMIQALVKLLSMIKEENWMLPIVYVTSVELRKLAICSDTLASENTNKRAAKPDAHIEEAATQLMNLFRVCANDSRTAIQFSKRVGMMNIITQLFKIYFRINKLNLYKPLVRALETANIMEHFRLSDRVTYSYFTGMKSLYDSDYRNADNLLSFAFKNCNPKMHNNRRIILIFLIPVKMLFVGFMPTLELLKKYNLLQFEPLSQAIKEGNLYAFDDAIEKNSDFFYYYGIYFTLEKLKTLIYRNIFKKVAKIANTHQIQLNDFVNAINYFQSNRNKIPLAEEDKTTIEEVHCLLANLIADNKLKGYISLQHQKLVISKKDPFPKLSNIL